MATIGLGWTLAYEEGSGYTTIAEVRKLSFPELAVGRVDSTHNGVTNYYKTSIAGMIDPGPVTAEVTMTEAKYLDLVEFLRVEQSYKITGNAAEPITCTFDGYLSKLGVPDISPEGLVVMNIEIQPVAGITFA